MNTMTVKRNGVYIVFPEKMQGKIKGEKINGVAKKQPLQVVMAREKNSARLEKQRSVLKFDLYSPKTSIIKVKKRCMHCGDEHCFNGSSYCWECYKYEHFESK